MNDTWNDNYEKTKTPTLLCIDDDFHIIEAVQLRLQDYEVEVITAFHGMHGYHEALTQKPDLIITDMRMPQGEGDYVVECLRNNPEQCCVPIIVLTGQRDPTLEGRMRRLGVQEFFAKPLRFNELQKAIVKYIPLHERDHTCLSR